MVYQREEHRDYINNVKMYVSGLLLLIHMTMGSRSGKTNVNLQG
jgi:hypothetical protein